ncbi:hypothetical protein L228DRAFT_27353 [Xylona heveae TC161]|uniref:Uncharacterized protein n=1 Tax=Xylona heveae (strain CBS 132557 / TC161) TaxID=1328760 RepID=A0A165AG36_XYLHT|nr:hypothetical protein L228DRAFT_27353 [Xylona heveae TC161]KZF20418.1 hypothetical protein L228DRAFT_27353 [Xylona heveae TC161]
MGKSPSRPALSSRGYTIRAVQPEPVYAPNSPEKDPNRFSLGQSLGVVNPDNNENDVREADDVDFEERNNTQDGSVQHEANTGANHAETSHEAHISQQSPVSALPIVSDPNVAMSLQTLTGTTTQGAYAVAERTAARSPHKNSQIPFRPYQVEVLNHGQEVRPATHRRSSTKDSYESSGYARRSSQGLLNTDQNGPGIGSDSSQLPSLAADVQAQQNDDHGRPRRSLHPRQHSTESYMQGPVLNHEEMLRAESRRRSMDLLRQFGGGSPVYLERRDSSGSTWSSSSKVGAHKKRRSSLFGLLSKPPTPEVPHGSRESAITHLANSKAEPDPANPPLKTQEGSGNSARPKDIAEKRGRNKLQRSSTSQFVQALDEKKKKRFSGLGVSLL